MKNIDELLDQSAPRKPKRNLSTDFTQRIVRQIVERPERQSKFKKIVSSLRMNTLQRPAIAVLLAVSAIALLGGTTYAAIIVFTNASVESKTTLPDGSSIVGIATNDCTVDEYDANTNTFTSTKPKYIYKVPEDSILEEQQLLQIVQGVCELATSNTSQQMAINQIIKDDPLVTENNTRGGKVDSTIDAIDNSNITISSSDYTYDGNGVVVDTENAIETISLDPSNLRVIDSFGKKIRFIDLSVGDRVSVSYRTERTPSGSVDTVAGIKDVAVLIMKNSENLSKSNEYNRYYGKEFTRVKPCTSDASSYCDFGKDTSQDVRLDK